MISCIASTLGCCSLNIVLLRERRIHAVSGDAGLSFVHAACRGPDAAMAGFGSFMSGNLFHPCMPGAAQIFWCSRIFEMHKARKGVRCPDSQLAICDGEPVS